MGLLLKSQVDVAIRAHGAETYPNECCGALIGRAGIVTQTLALPNMTDEGPRRRFLVTPNDYREAERRAGEVGGELLGFITRTRTTRRSRHSTIWTMRGRTFRM